MPKKKLKVLIVCRWPVGGIRTYLKYNYRHFSSDEFEITLLANREREYEYVELDMGALGIKIRWVEPILGWNVLPLCLLWLLLTRRFDVIHSQGFISGFHVATVNKLFGVPHVLTVHGILEKEHFEGRFEQLKRFLFRRALRNVTVFHGVSQDVLTHVQEEFPSLKTYTSEWVVINNGIDPTPYLEISPDAAGKLRKKYAIDYNTSVFGFFGRLIHEKGFEYVIEAVDIMRMKCLPERKFVVLVLAQGDFYREYRADVTRLGLDDFFQFEQTEPEIDEIIAGCDAVLMPSNWEAWGLLANEALCAGVPLIASNCIGLREAIADTPTLVVPPRDGKALSEAMLTVMTDPATRDQHRQYAKQAIERFDVIHSANKMLNLFREMQRRVKTVI